MCEWGLSLCLYSGQMKKYGYCDDSRKIDKYCTTLPPDLNWGEIKYNLIKMLYVRHVYWTIFSQNFPKQLDWRSWLSLLRFPTAPLCNPSLFIVSVCWFYLLICGISHCQGVEECYGLKFCTDLPPRVPIASMCLQDVCVPCRAATLALQGLSQAIYFQLLVLRGGKLMMDDFVFRIWQLNRYAFRTWLAKHLYPLPAQNQIE